MRSESALPKDLPTASAADPAGFTATLRRHVAGVKGPLGAVLLAAGRHMVRRRRSARVVVFCYHSIHPTKTFASATPRLFEQHLDWLREHCAVVQFRQVLSAAVSGEGQDRPVVAITFDDGYADNYHYAFPLLEKYGLGATFFLTAGLIERDPEVMARFQRFPDRANLDDVRPLEWPQVREMRQAGMDFGAHTYSHPNLARLTLSAVREELKRSKEIIEDRLGEQTAIMAYPFGKPKRHYTVETMNVALETGYTWAAAIIFRGVHPSHSRLAIPRFFVTRDDLGMLADKIFGVWDLVGVWHERAPAFMQQFSEAIR